MMQQYIKFFVHQQCFYLIYLFCLLLSRVLRIVETFKKLWKASEFQELSGELLNAYQ